MKLLRILFLVAAALPGAAMRAAPPPLDITSAYGVNIHASLLYPGDLARIRAAGFTWVRVDLGWKSIEGARGVYDFSSFDVLARGLEAEGLRAIVVLAYGNPLYADWSDSPLYARRNGTEEFRAAYAAFCVAAVARYSGRGYIWEQWNEPNNKHFWPPTASSNSYVALMRRTCAAIRVHFPNELIAGPATSYVDLPFIEGCLRGGMLDYWSAVTVHPYRQSEPETRPGLREAEGPDRRSCGPRPRSRSLCGMRVTRAHGRAMTSSSRRIS